MTKGYKDWKKSTLPHFVIQCLYFHYNVLKYMTKGLNSTLAAFPRQQSPY